MSAGRAAMVQMLISRVVALFAMMVGFAVLGRILMPSDFGHFAIAAAAFQSFKSLANFGLRQYIIRSDGELDPDTLASASGFSLAIAAIGCVAFVGARWVAGDFIAPAVATALVPLGIALLASPAILSVEVQLQRAMAFRLPAYAAMAASMTEILVGILMALSGFGAVALALGLMASEIVSALVLYLFGRVAHRPALRLRAREIPAYLRFGGNLTAINAVPSVVTLILVSSLGALAGAATTGLYNRSKTVLDLLDRIVFDGVGPVVLPLISQALRDGMAPQKVLAVKLDYLTVLCWPALALIGLLAKPMVLLMLGDQWLAAVPAVRILALSGLALPLTKMSVKFFIAIDALDAYLGIQISFQIVTLVLGVIGAALSLEAFCVAISIGLIFKAVAIGWWLQRRYPHGNGVWVAALGRGAAVTLATVAGPVPLLLAGGLQGIALLSVAAVVAAICWLLALFALGHPLVGDLRQIFVPQWHRVAGRLFR